jgi:hypothetical protein
MLWETGFGKVFVALIPGGDGVRFLIFDQSFLFSFFLSLLFVFEGCIESYGVLQGFTSNYKVYLPSPHLHTLHYLPR